MSDEKHSTEEQNELSRRDFVAMGIAAGIVAASGAASAADMPVTEKDVEIKTPDGTCNAAFIHPTTGAHPAVHHLGGRVRPAPGVARDGAKRWRRKATRCSCRTRSIVWRRHPGLDPRTFNFGNTDRPREAGAADGFDQRGRRGREGRARRSSRGSISRRK